MSKPVVAYYRVSTLEQGKSGLGIDAQRASVARFAEAEGLDLVAKFTGVETGNPCTLLRDESRVVRALRARYRAMMKRAEDSGTIHRPTKIEFTCSD
jgi:hypothetical protein